MPLRWSLWAAAAAELRTSRSGTRINKSDNHWIWSQTTGAGEYQGFFTQPDVLKKRWGTNRVADPRPNGPGDPSDPGAMDYSNLFDKGVISDTTGVRHFQTNDGVFRDIIASLVVYDQAGQPGTPAYGVNNNLEVQAVPGDSGSAVFFKRGNQWELAGIVNAAFTYNDQPDGTAMFGNATMFTDLSKYNQNYFHSIQNIIATHPDYSLSGDVNLDGIVSGNGTGPASTDDVTAFIAGWNYNNGISQGTITSWKNGDLTRDGRTDVADFLRLRGALNGQISSAVVAALFGSNAIPEPSAAMLVLLGGLHLRIRTTAALSGRDSICSTAALLFSGGACPARRPEQVRHGESAGADSTAKWSYLRTAPTALFAVCRRCAYHSATFLDSHRARILWTISCRPLPFAANDFATSFARPRPTRCW